MVEEMSTYTITAERSGKWWVLQAVEAPGAISQVARLDQADQIKEAIAFVTDEPVDTIELELRPVLPAAAQEARRRAESLRADAAKANSEAALQSRRAAHILADAGLTMRDIGTVLGVSYQRAQQLVASDVVRSAGPGLGELIAVVNVIHPSELTGGESEDALRGAPASSHAGSASTAH
jgi:hypothetical protein